MIDESEVLNWGVKIGSQARVEEVKRDQLENLIASLEVVGENNALLFTAVFAKRQASRGVLGEITARRVGEAMKYLHEKKAGRKEARKMLGFAKWVYEAVGSTLQKPLADLVDLVEVITTERM